MTISSVSQNPIATAVLQKASTAAAPRDGDHDGDTDKAGQADVDKTSSARKLDINV